MLVFVYVYNFCNFWLRIVSHDLHPFCRKSNWPSNAHDLISLNKSVTFRLSGFSVIKTSFKRRKNLVYFLGGKLLFIPLVDVWVFGIINGFLPSRSSISETNKNKND